MNPSIFFPDLQDRPWNFCLWSEKAIVVCSCIVQKMINDQTTEKKDVKPVSFRDTVVTNKTYKARVAIGTCPYCQAIHWMCDDLPALIMLCQQKERI